MQHLDSLHHELITDASRMIIYSLLILVLGTVLQNPREFQIVEQALLDRRLSVHFVHLEQDEKAISH